MGTKRRLAPRVAAIVNEMRPGPALDLFAGMCSVGREIAVSRNVWTNDAQRFASAFGVAMFTSRAPKPLPESFWKLAHQTNVESDEIAALIKSEAKVLRTAGLAELQRLHGKLSRFRSLTPIPDGRYFTRTYPGTYLGLQQCVDLDAIRCAIDAIDNDSDKRWALIALCAAAFRASTSTGHFAQYLRPKESTLRFFIRKRRLSLLTLWREYLIASKPLGNAAWRRGNKAYMGDAIDVLKTMRGTRSRPAIIYADPPYTRDHYSRFYHLYETIWNNDQPNVVGRGLCRDDTKPSQFSTKSLVDKAMKSLLDESAAIGADVVLSYPTNGLLEDARRRLRALLKERYSVLEIVTIQGDHSTLGASKGLERQAVTELLFKATGAR